VVETEEAVVDTTVPAVAAVVDIEVAVEAAAVVVADIAAVVEEDEAGAAFARTTSPTVAVEATAAVVVVVPVAQEIALAPINNRIQVKFSTEHSSTCSTQ
jgi:hypothetical protein